jgi:pimeloyl-ACP methyl ester carboxylesterase
MPVIMFRRLLFVALVAGLAGCKTPDSTRLDRSLAALRTNPTDPRAQAAYRKAAAAMLPDLLEKDASAKSAPGWVAASSFSDIDPVRRPRDTVAGLHRPGVGVPMVGQISRKKSGDPNAPRAGFMLPLTALVVPAKSGGYEAKLADPRVLSKVNVEGTSMPLAMNLEAPLDKAQDTGPRFGAGILYLLRVDRFGAPAQLGFLQPYDPNKTPVVFVHGLMSTPRMWVPVIKQLMSVKEIRDRYQFWFFYYPTGQPVPASALQLREALNAAQRFHHNKKPVVLVGHSMGGILSRAQVSQITEKEAVGVVPWLAKLSAGNIARRALIFEPRTDVSRVIFLNVPHRGSRMALTGFAGIGMQLIRLPSNLLNEVEELGKFIIPGGRGRMPTSIQGLSPDSPFLAMLNKRAPGVPHNTVLGDRGRGDSPNSSDGVVPYSSAHLGSAQTEAIVPGGHGSFSHPKAVRELERILIENR